jgi:hypothetical protein
MVLFKDLSKNGKDLLTKDFPSKKELKWEMPQKDDLSLTATVAFQDSDISASINPKYNYKPLNAEISATFETQQIVKTDITVKDQLVKGMKNVFKFQLDPVNKMTIRKELEYVDRRYTIAAGLDILNPKSQNIVGSGVYSLNTFDVGVEAEYSLAKSELRRVQLAGQTKIEPYNMEIGAFAKFAGDNKEFGVNIFERYSKQTLIAVEVAANPEKQAITSATVGVSTALDNDTGVKTKLQYDGTIGLAFSRKVSDSLKIIFGTTVNVQSGIKGWGIQATVAN